MHPGIFITVCWIKFYMHQCRSLIQHPLGRILNRFSRDLDVIDSNIPVFLRGWLFVIAPLLSTCVLIIYTSPIILAVLAPLGIVYYVIQVCTFCLFCFLSLVFYAFYLPSFLHTLIFSRENIDCVFLSNSRKPILIM